MKPLIIIVMGFLTLNLGAEEEGWIDLFDGKTIEGWKPNSDEGAYRVVDGVLRLQATHPENRGHIFYVGDDDELDLFADFELEVVAKGESGSNSGIFFHTDKKTRDEVLHLASGYEVQLNSSQPRKWQTGSLYDVVDTAEKVVDETDWFTVRILVEGKRIQVWLNETRTVDYTEPENVLEQRSEKRKGRVLRQEGGAIALQAHDEKSVFYFRSIRIRKI